MHDTIGYYATFRLEGCSLDEILQLQSYDLGKRIAYWGRSSPNFYILHETRHTSQCASPAKTVLSNACPHTTCFEPDRALDAQLLSFIFGKDSAPGGQCTNGVKRVQSDSTAHNNLTVLPRTILCRTLLACATPNKIMPCTAIWLVYRTGCAEASRVQYKQRSLCTRAAYVKNADFPCDAVMGTEIHYWTGELHVPSALGNC